MCSTRNRRFIFPVQGLVGFWAMEVRGPGCSTLWDTHRAGCSTQCHWGTEQQLSPHAGMPAASWETPLGHHPSCPGSSSLTHTALALTPARLWFMRGSCSKASRAPLPARRHQSQVQHPHQGPVQPTENHREDRSTALLRVQLSQIREIQKINKVLIYCGKEKAGSGKWVGEWEKQKLCLEKKENLKLNEACTPYICSFSVKINLKIPKVS